MIYHSDTMPHVSKNKLKKKTFLRIGTQLQEKIAKANSKSDINWFTEALLTPTEKIMMAKRLAIILMLEKGYPFWAIELTLKVTQQTIVRFWKKMKLRPDLFKFKTENRGVGPKPSNFWKNLEEMFTILPPRGRQWEFMRHAITKHSR